MNDQSQKIFGHAVLAVVITVITTWAIFFTEVFYYPKRS